MTVADIPVTDQVEITVHDHPTTLRTWRWGESTGQPPLLVLPGFVTASARVVPVAEELSAGRSVLALDYPGVGGSPTWDRTPTIPELGRHVAGCLDELRTGAVDLVGSSFGCQVAVEVALTRPDLVARLILSSPVQDPSARRLPTLLQRWRKEGATQSQPYKRLMIHDFLHTDPRQVLTLLGYTMRDRIEDKLPFVGAPTLVMYGTADPLITRRWAERVAQLLPDGELAVLPGAPHGMVFDAELETARSIETFLRNHPVDDERRRSSS
jgi:2-hydroxy-6-oxonona-2,4-dienedioate hydrolase